MSTRTSLAPAVAALALVGSLSCDGGPASPAPTGLVIITLDTTRADHLSVYGYMDVSLPHLERLAANGVVFDQAVSVGALTLPAHTSLFTGLLPPAHGVRDNSDPGLGDSYVTLAEALRARGFSTAAFVGSVVLDADRGLAQGFDRYDGVRPDGDASQRRGNEVVDDAMDWLAGVGSAPFFLWAHLYDPHRPYDPPPPFDAMHDPYVGEIAFVDQQIGRLLAALDAHGLTGRTIVVVAGDHGEARGDHGERDHGVFLYQGVLRVPLIMHAPGIRARRVADVVRLTDIMPTVLDLLRVPVPSSDGATLAGVLHGHLFPVEREAYAESLYPRHLGWSPLFALRNGRYKLVDAPRPELYDLESDPFEERNIYQQRRGLAAAMMDRVARIRAAAEATYPARELELPPELHDRLAALGYVSGTPGLSASRSGQLPDAKDCIGASQLAAKVAGVVPPRNACTTSVVSRGDISAEAR
jgi:arylsulfatase A-like enzyme